MSRLLAACVVLIGSCLSGCASGPPVGARRAALTASYPTFSRPAAPRRIPDSVPTTVAAVRRPSRQTREVNPDARSRAVATARDLVGQRSVVIAGQRYQDDCTGLITGVYGQVGLDVMSSVKPGDNAVTAIYRYAQSNGRIFHGGRPLPGDLVFFRETYDQNRDGHSNDGLTHIGIVEDVDSLGTVTVIHRVSRGVVRYRMNLTRPDLRRDPRTGRVLNDYLRHSGPGRRELLTGQLFAAYATVLPPGSIQSRAVAQK